MHVVYVVVDEGFDWSAVPALAQLNAAHITETARMLLGAVNRGDQAAAEWLADILSKWWGKFEFQEQPYSLYGKTSFLTIEMLKQDWAELHNELSLSEEDIRWEGGTTIALQRGVLFAALQNFWADIRLLVLEILLSWLIQSFNSHAQKSLALEIAGGLLVGKQWRQGGTSAESLAGLATTDYLTAKALRACEVREITASDASSYWNVLKTEAARIRASGMTPVLVLNNATKPEWVWQWQHGLPNDKYQRPQGMSVQKRDGRGAGYLCDFDDIEVYVGLPTAGQSVLVARETFKSVSFQLFGPERYVDISAHERSDTKLLYDLKLKFSRRVDAGFAEAVRIVYTAS